MWHVDKADPIRCATKSIYTQLGLQIRVSRRHGYTKSSRHFTSYGDTTGVATTAKATNVRTDGPMMILLNSLVGLGHSLTPDPLLHAPIHNGSDGFFNVRRWSLPSICGFFR